MFHQVWCLPAIMTLSKNAFPATELKTLVDAGTSWCPPVILVCVAVTGPSTWTFNSWLAPVELLLCVMNPLLLLLLLLLVGTAKLVLSTRTHSLLLIPTDLLSLLMKQLLLLLLLLADVLDVPSLCWNLWLLWLSSSGH